MNSDGGHSREHSKPTNQSPVVQEIRYRLATLNIRGSCVLDSLFSQEGSPDFGVPSAAMAPNPGFEPGSGDAPSRRSVSDSFLPDPPASVTLSAGRSQQRIGIIGSFRPTAQKPRFPLRNRHFCPTNVATAEIQLQELKIHLAVNIDLSWYGLDVEQQILLKILSLQDFTPQRIVDQVDVFRQASANLAKLRTVIQVLEGIVCEELGTNEVDAIRDWLKGVGECEALHASDLNDSLRLAWNEIAVRLHTAVTAVMRHPEFVIVESSWRGLSSLAAACDFRESPSLCYVDCSRDELVRDFAKGYEQSCFFRILRDAYLRSAGELPFHLLIVNFEFSDSPEDIACLSELGRFGRSLHCPVIAVAETSLANRVSTWSSGEMDPSVDAPWSSELKMLRRCEEADYLVLTAPGDFELPHRLSEARIKSPAFAVNRDATSVRSESPVSQRSPSARQPALWALASQLAIHLGEFGVGNTIEIPVTAPGQWAQQTERGRLFDFAKSARASRGKGFLSESVVDPVSLRYCLTHIPTLRDASSLEVLDIDHAFARTSLAATLSGTLLGLYTLCAIRDWHSSADPSAICEVIRRAFVKIEVPDPAVFPDFWSGGDRLATVRRLSVTGAPTDASADDTEVTAGELFWRIQMLLDVHLPVHRTTATIPIDLYVPRGKTA